MNDVTDIHRSRLGALALGSSGILFFLYQAARPFTDTAETMASSAWVISHLFAMGGFILFTLGLLGLRSLMNGTANEPLALRGAVVSWIGAGLTLPYYGAEVFGLNVIARRALEENDPSLLELAAEFRYGTVPVVMFAGGLLLLGVGAVMASVAIWRSGTAGRWGAALMATGFVLFIPQFFTPQPVRIVHGLLIAAGTVWIAGSVLRRRRQPSIN